VTMALSIHNQFDSLASIFSGSVLAGIVYEVFVLAVFGGSFLLWHYMKYRRLRRPQKDASLKLPYAITKQPELGSVQKTRKVAPSSASACQKGDAAAAHATVNKEKSPRGAHALDASSASIIEASKKMIALLERREFTRALHMYRSLERSHSDSQISDPAFFTAFILSAARVDKSDVAEKMIRVMKRNKVYLGTQNWQTILKILSTKKWFSMCLLVHKLFEEQLPCDKVVYSCLINAALEVSEPQRAEAMLPTYQKCDIDVKEYILFFRTYVALGKVDQAEAIFHMLGDQTTSLMLNLLLLTCVNEKQLDRAMDSLHKAHKLDIGKKEPMVNIVSYNTLIKGYAQAGMLDQCCNAVQMLTEHGLEPDDVTLCTLLDPGLIGNNTSIAEKLVGLTRIRRAPKNTFICTNVMKILIRVGKLDEASELYELMKQSEETRPDVVACSMLIKACVQAHDLQRALYVVDDMVSLGCAPDDIILTHVLEGCCHDGKHHIGRDLFERVVATGVAPSDYTFLSLVKLLGRTGANDEAFRYVAEREQRFGTKPSVIHFTCLMSGCLRAKKFEQGWQAYLLMKKHGVQPDETTLSTLLPGIAGAQQWDRVIRIMEDAAKLPKLPALPSEALNVALSQMVAAGDQEPHVVRLQQLMRGAGVPVNFRPMNRKA